MKKWCCHIWEWFLWIAVEPFLATTGQGTHSPTTPSEHKYRTSSYICAVKLLFIFASCSSGSKGWIRLDWESICHISSVCWNSRLAIFFWHFVVKILCSLNPPLHLTIWFTSWRLFGNILCYTGVHPFQHLPGTSSLLSLSLNSTWEHSFRSMFYTGTLPASDRLLPVVQASPSTTATASLKATYVALVIAFLTSCLSVLFRFTALCGKVCNIWSNTRCRFYCIHSLGPYFVFVLACSSMPVCSPPFPCWILPAVFFF